MTYRAGDWIHTGALAPEFELLSTRRIASLQERRDAIKLFLEKEQQAGEEKHRVPSGGLAQPFGLGLAQESGRAERAWATLLRA